MYCLYLVAPCKVKRKLTSGRLYSGTFRKRPLKMSSLGGKICEPAGSPRSRGEHYCVKCSWEVCIFPRVFHTNTSLSDHLATFCSPLNKFQKQVHGILTIKLYLLNIHSLTVFEKFALPRTKKIEKRTKLQLQFK